MSKQQSDFLNTRRLFHGAAYYPEQWPAAEVAREIERMKQCGLNVVRMGEFAWAQMEPEEGRISLDFFRDVMDQLHEAGIGTVFCTPTATPPIWLTDGHPERCFVDQQGHVMSHGARQHICTDHPYVRERCRVIVREIARALGKHPGLVAWQTDNEFKCHVAENYSDSARVRWHQWLEARFGDIEALNEAWGTSVWSERYQRFDQVPMPVIAPCMHNASLETAFQEFARDMIVEFQEEQVAAIREHSSAPVTHNGNLFFNVDPVQLTQILDFASFDHYVEVGAYDEILLHIEVWRQLKRGRPFWVMETSSGHNGSLVSYHRPHPPGFVRAEAIAAYCLGGIGFSYWVWRQQRSGAELTHGSVYSAWGAPAMGHANVLQVTEAKDRIEPFVLESELIPSEVAIHWSDKARRFLRTESLEKLDYIHLMRGWAKHLRRAGVTFDFVGEEAPLDSYKLLFTPYMLNVDARLRQRVEAFVREGGVWIAGPLTGGRTEHHTVHTDAGLGALDALGGVETEFTYPITGSGSIGHAFSHSAPLRLWGHLFRPTTANAIGTVSGGPTPGRAFITERRLGRGKIVLIGALPEGAEGEAMLVDLARHYAREAHVERLCEATEGTIVARRLWRDQELWCVVNMDGKGGSVRLAAPARDVISGLESPAGTCAISPFEYRLLALEPELTSYSSNSSGAGNSHRSAAGA